jgi:hypothetical protein
VKRSEVLARIKRQARDRGLTFEVIGLTRHDAVRVGATTRTLGRHSEIDDVTARTFFDQFADEFGKGWWR